MTLDTLANNFVLDSLDATVQSSSDPVARHGTGGNLLPSADVPPSIPAEQVYYWSRHWQSGECLALQDIEQGRVKQFADADSAIRWLLEHDGD